MGIWVVDYWFWSLVMAQVESNAIRVGYILLLDVLGLVLVDTFLNGWDCLVELDYHEGDLAESIYWLINDIILSVWFIFKKYFWTNFTLKFPRFQIFLLLKWFINDFKNLIILVNWTKSLISWDFNIIFIWYQKC